MWPVDDGAGLDASLGGLPVHGLLSIEPNVSSRTSVQSKEAVSRDTMSSFA